MAQTTSWKGTASTSWTSSSNWTNGVPTSASNVVIGDANFTGSYNPSLSSAITIASLTIGGENTASLSINRALTINGALTIYTNGSFSDVGNGTSTTVKGDWTNNGVFSTNSNQTVVFSGTTQTIGGSSPTAFNKITINAGTTVKLASDISGIVTLNGTLIPNEDARLNSGSLSVGSAATLHITATSYSGNYAMHPTLATGNTIVYSGTQNQTISNFTYSTLRISGEGVKSLTGDLTTFMTTTGNGNVYVDGGTLDLKGFNITRATSGGTFSVANGASLRIGGTVSFPLNFSTVSISNGSTVEYYGTTQTVRAGNYGNLTTSGARGASSLTFPSTATYNIAGHLTASDTYTTGSRIVTGTSFVFMGSNTQTISGFTFNNLTINNASDVNLTGDITVNGTLNFTTGTINTATNRVIMPAGSLLSGAGSSTGWVNGHLQKYFSATTGGIFEIGNATSYLPLPITFSSITSAGSLIAGSTEEAHPNGGSSVISNNRLSRYWTLSYPASGALAFSGASMTLNWTAADNYINLNTAYLMVAQHNGASWSYPAANTPTTTSIKITGVGSVGSFTVGQVCATNFSFVKSTFCSSDGTANPVLNQGATAGTFSATPAGLSINTATGAINLNASAAGTYTVTNTLTGSCSMTSTATVSVAMMPSADINYTGSPFCNSGTGTVTLTGIAGGTFSSTTGLVITTSTGAINLGSSTPNTYTVTYTIAANSVCPQFQTTTTVMIGPGFWKGTTNTDWNTLTNWSCITLPLATNDVVIPSGRTFYPVLSTGQTGATRNLTIQSGASLTLNTATLKISGTIINNGTFDASANGSVEFTGTAAQTIPASVFAGNKIYDLINSNPTSLTLQGSLDIINTLSLKAGTFYTNGYLTLKSSAANTARVDQITSTSATPIVGDVTVERYVPSKRKYRLLAPSVTTSTKETLAVGEEALSIWAHWQNSGVNTTPNSGMLITGGTAADGFDTQTSSASLYTYNESTRKFVAFNSTAGKKTKYTPLRTGRAYYLFVYGDRRNAISSSTVPNETVLKAKGTLAVGNQAFTATSASPLSSTSGNFALIGNPFACPVDWKNVTKMNVSNTLWGWDANLNSTGGYVTVTATATGAIISPISNLVQVSRYLQPGQGFFVKTTAANPQVIFSEGHKVSNLSYINNQVFRTADATPQPLMAINLLYNNAGTPVLADGAVAAFDSSYSKEVTEEEDGIKMVNSNDGLSLLENGNLLGINSLPMPQTNDTLQISFSRLTKSQYTLEIFAQDLGVTAAPPYLQDTYLNTMTPLSLADTNRVAFNVIASDPASASTNRFRILFAPFTTLPVTFTSVTAAKKERAVVVEWKTENESGTQKYEVERAAGNGVFTKIGELPARGNGQQVYQWLDRSPVAGTNRYHIRSVESHNKYQYSKSVAVEITAGKAAVAVVPNPVKMQRINVLVKNVEEGPLTIYLFDQKGNEVIRQTVDHRGLTASYSVTPRRLLASGIYYLKLLSQNEEFNLEVLIE